MQILQYLVTWEEALHRSHVCRSSLPSFRDGVELAVLHAYLHLPLPAQYWQLAAPPDIFLDRALQLQVSVDYKAFEAGHGAGCIFIIFICSITGQSG